MWDSNRYQVAFDTGNPHKVLFTARLLQLLTTQCNGVYSTRSRICNGEIVSLVLGGPDDILMLSKDYDITKSGLFVLLGGSYLTTINYGVIGLHTGKYFLISGRHPMYWSIFDEIKKENAQAELWDIESEIN